MTKEDETNNINSTINKKELEENVRSTIKSTVQSTNKLLGSMEYTSHQISSSLVSRVRSIGGIVEHGFQRASYAYEKRFQYGPAIVMGTGVCFGGLVALRRGKLPGALTGALTGSAAYTAIYRPDVLPSPSSKSD